MEKIISINCSEIYRRNSFSLYPSVHIDRSFSSMYTNGITIRKEKMKKIIILMRHATYGIVDEINLWLIFINIYVGNI